MQSINIMINHSSSLSITAQNTRLNAANRECAWNAKRLPDKDLQLRNARPPGAAVHPRRRCLCANAPSTVLTLLICIKQWILEESMHLTHNDHYHSAGAQSLANTVRSASPGNCTRIALAGNGRPSA